MKKLFFTLVVAFVAMTASAQTVGKSSAGKAVKVFTMLYAESDDGFVNVRSKASASGKIVGQINAIMYGLGNAMLIEKSGSWWKVKTADGKVGYANSGFLGSMTWYNGGKRVLVAKTNCPLYREDFGNEPSRTRRGKPMFTLTEGTIIADEFQYDKRTDCYVLVSAHDGIYIPRKFCVEKTK